MYCVIFGDIIRSRTKEKNEIDKDVDYVEEVLEQINTKYQANIFAPFECVRGDAFEGILFSQQDIPGILQDIIKLCWNGRRIALRISAVMDELTKADLDTEQANGPAFIKAINAIDEMRADKSEHWFQVRIITNTIAQPLIDGILSLLSELTGRWTEKQRELVWAMSNYTSQTKLVSDRKVPASVVSRQLKAAGFKAYEKAWKCLEEYFNDAEDALIQYQSKGISYTTYYSMGQRKNKLRDYSSAIIDFEKSIELATKEFGDHDYRLVLLYNGLAQAHLEVLSSDETKEEERTKAISEARKAIESSLLCQAGKPSITMEYAKTINIQGNYYLETGDYDAALKCFGKAKEIIQARYGDKHPMLVNCDNNMAIAYKEKGEYRKALRLYQICLEAAEAKKEQDPLDYADSLYNISLCHYEMMEYNKALNYAKQAADILSAALPAKNEYVIEVKGKVKEIEREAEHSSEEEHRNE